MKPKLMLTALVVFFVTSSIAQKSQPIPGQYIVILKESAATPVINKQKKNDNREQKFNDNNQERQKNLDKLKEVRQKKNIKESSVLSEYADVTVGFSAKLTDKEKKDLEADPEIEGVYLDYSFNIGPGIPESDINTTPVGVSPTSTQTIGCNITNAGGFVDGSSKSTSIWLLDTGADMDHPDLNIQKNATFAKSFVPYQAIEDLSGHGTHCAGIAAAKNNSFGVVGVSAGAKIIPVKVLNNNVDGQVSWLLAGLNHVAKYDIPGDVVSMSLGGSVSSNCENLIPALRYAIKAMGMAGTWIVMGAGNDGDDAAKFLPGCINGTRVLTVGSIDCRNACSSTSNFNLSVVDWVATGENVFSTYKNWGYAKLSGTSMSTPAVAGIVHSKNNYPASGGTVICKRLSYKIAIR